RIAFDSASLVGIEAHQQSIHAHGRHDTAASSRRRRLPVTTVASMPFPKKNLNANETIALDMHPHWWYFAEPAWSLLGSIILGIIVLAKTHGDVGKMLRVMTVRLLVGTAVWLVIRYMKWLTTNFVITS